MDSAVSESLLFCSVIQLWSFSFIFLLLVSFRQSWFYSFLCCCLWSVSHVYLLSPSESSQEIRELFCFAFCFSANSIIVILSWVKIIVLVPCLSCLNYKLPDWRELSGKGKLSGLQGKMTATMAPQLWCSIQSFCFKVGLHCVKWLQSTFWEYTSLSNSGPLTQSRFLTLPQKTTKHDHIPGHCKMSINYYRADWTANIFPGEGPLETWGHAWCMTCFHVNGAMVG